jgi:hypothetical protein
VDQTATMSAPCVPAPEGSNTGFDAGKPKLLDIMRRLTTTRGRLRLTLVISSGRSQKPKPAKYLGSNGQVGGLFVQLSGPEQVPRPVLGVNLAGGVAYLVLVKAADDIALDDAVKIAPAKGLTDATRLKDFGDRFLQEVKRLGVKTVAVARPRKYRGWIYAHAFERIALEAAMMLTVEGAGVRYVSVKQDKEAARLVGVSKPEEVENELADLLGLKDVKHWNERSVALMVALALVKEGSS